MKKALLILLILATTNFAQVVFSESFNYSDSPADSLKAHNWSLSGTNNLNPLMVTSPGLSLTDYYSAGNATTLKESGQDVYQKFSPITSGVVYFSFLINVSSTSSIGDYFIAISPSSSQTNYYARVHLKSSNNGFSIGISKNNELAGGYEYGKTTYNFNTTYLVVVKHSLLAGAKNDEERIFVFSNNVPSTEPAISEVGPYVETTKNDPTDIAHVTIRQGGSFSGGVMTNPGPTLKLDEIRIATSWKDLLVPTDVKENSIPTQFQLNQNYPNPFNPETIISYQLPESKFVTLKVYDVLGNEISTLVNELQNAGMYHYTFSTLQNSLPSGIYIYKLQAGNFVSVKKMMLVK